MYLIYGMYECLNIVAEPAGRPGCVLVRALQPVAGIEIMRQRRPAARRIEDLASGPGKLTLALGITRAHNGAELPLRFVVAPAVFAAGGVVRPDTHRRQDRRRYS